jgi:hypothetical protein
LGVDTLWSEVSATDIPVLVTGGFFRLAADRYYVPITVAVPGSAVTVPPGKDKATLDVLGVVRDEQGRPVGRMRQTMDLAAGAGAALESKQVLYQSGVTLPPGRFALKVVVRENVNGAVGSFETGVVVPELKQAPVKVSSVILSTQLQTQAARGRTDNPLVRDGMQIVPNVTHVVGRDQKLFFYFEVYEPAVAESMPDVRASLAFYRKDQGARDAGGRTGRTRCSGSEGGTLQTRGAGGRVQAGTLYLPGQRHRCGGGKVRVSEAGDAGEVI